MALSFMKKKSAATTDEPEKGTASEEAKTPSSTEQSKAAAQSDGPKVSFLKKGKAAVQAVKEEEARAEARRAEAGKMFHFFMKEGQDRTITFLDGDLNENGMLDIHIYHEHTLRINGDIKNFVCTAEIDESQPCPICEKGGQDGRPSLIGLMTVIDHTPHTIQNGPNAGKTIQHDKKVFKAKMSTLKLLTKLAVKRGGLKGCTFDVSRTGKMEPNVGNQFDFTKKWDDWDEFMAKYDLKPEDIAPANYEEEITYHPPEKLIEMGVGKAFSGVGTSTKSNADKKSLQDQL